jgi:NifU-like protein involved in Fe-S cluster formation
MLALATGLAEYPLDPALPLQGEARSRTCGSAIRLGLALDERARIARIGMQVSACAIGQASAMLLAQSACGERPEAIVEMTAAWEGWLAGEGALPDWPGADVLAPARDHPGRHGALMLPWKAACMALSTAAAGG